MRGGGCLRGSMSGEIPYTTLKQIAEVVQSKGKIWTYVGVESEAETYYQGEDPSTADSVAATIPELAKRVQFFFLELIVNLKIAL